MCKTIDEGWELMSQEEMEELSGERIVLHNADCYETLKGLADNSVDAIITDPPYDIGFMGKGWDKKSLITNVDFWKECLRVLKSGGHLLAFGHSRTSHRMVSAVEDAGFEIRDTIMWIYGSGFPKSHNVGKAVDKKLGNGNSEWEGWGSALKPAHEPVVLARKPLEGTMADNVLKHGVGALNIDATRIGHNEDFSDIKGRSVIINSGCPEGHSEESESFLKAKEKLQTLGRWAANVILDEEAAKVLDEQAPNKGSLFSAKRKKETTGGSGDSWTNGGKDVGEENGFYDLPSGASKFFYCAKVSKKERNAGVSKNHHPTVKPVALMEYLIKLVTRDGQTVLDPFMGSGSTGIASKKLNRNFIGCEKEKEYYEIAKARIENWE